MKSWSNQYPSLPTQKECTTLLPGKHLFSSVTLNSKQTESHARILDAVELNISKLSMKSTSQIQILSQKLSPLTLSGRRYYYYCVIERKMYVYKCRKTHFISKWRPKSSSWRLFSLIVVSKLIMDVSSYNDDIEFLRVDKTWV